MMLDYLFLGGALTAVELARHDSFKHLYVCQDKLDDVHAGVKSTALLFGDSTRIWLSGFAAMSVAGLTLAGASSCSRPCAQLQLTMPLWT